VSFLERNNGAEDPFQEESLCPNYTKSPLKVKTPKSLTINQIPSLRDKSKTFVPQTKDKMLSAEDMKVIENL